MTTQNFRPSKRAGRFLAPYQTGNHRAHLAQQGIAGSVAVGSGDVVHIGEFEIADAERLVAGQGVVDQALEMLVQEAVAVQTRQGIVADLTQCIAIDCTHLGA
jgi:hypothetical protein